MPLFIGFNGSSSCTYQQWWLSFVNGWCNFFWQYSAATKNPPLFDRIQLSSLKNHYPSYDIVLAEICNVDRSLSSKSNKIEFALIGLLQLQIFNFEWPNVNIGRMQDLSLKAVISMLFFFYIFLVLNFQKGMDVSFLIPLESLHFDL